MYILKQTNILKYGLITVGLIISLFCFYVIVGFLGIQYLMEPYQYGTFFAWVIILFGVFYRFTFLLLTVGVFFGIINVGAPHSERFTRRRTPILHKRSTSLRNVCS